MAFDFSLQIKCFKPSLEKSEVQLLTSVIVFSCDLCSECVMGIFSNIYRNGHAEKSVITHSLPTTALYTFDDNSVN